MKKNIMVFYETEDKGGKKRKGYCWYSKSLFTSRRTTVQKMLKRIELSVGKEFIVTNLIIF